MRSLFTTPQISESAGNATRQSTAQSSLRSLPHQNTGWWICPSKPDVSLNHDLASQIHSSMMGMISELYTMNSRSWEFICFPHVVSFLFYFFPEKKSQSKFLLGFFELVLALLPRGWRSWKKNAGYHWVM